MTVPVVSVRAGCTSRSAAAISSGMSSRMTEQTHAIPHALLCRPCAAACGLPSSSARSLQRPAAHRKTISSASSVRSIPFTRNCEPTASHTAPSAPTAISSRSHLRVPSLRNCGFRRAALMVGGSSVMRSACVSQALAVGVDLRLAQQQQFCLRVRARSRRVRATSACVRAAGSARGHLRSVARRADRRNRECRDRRACRSRRCGRTFRHQRRAISFEKPALRP